MLRGSEERLAPILMTALATGLALVPLALAGNKPGHEIEHPMAVVILGGLVTSTVLNLFLMPALYLAFGHAPAARPRTRPDASWRRLARGRMGPESLESRSPDVLARDSRVNVQADLPNALVG